MVFLGIVFLLVVISVIFLIAFGVHVGTASGKNNNYVSSILTYTIVLQRLLYVV